MEPQDRTRNWRSALFRRFAATTALSWAMMALYLLINRYQVGEHTIVLMPDWVPFWPAFILPYQGLLLMTWILPITLQDATRFRACLRAYAYSFLLVMPWWILLPTMLPRPPLPEGMWATAFEWIWKVDRPFNVAPCAHAVGPIIASWFVSQEYPQWRWPLAGVLLLGLPSIALVWQHRPVDILLGGVAAGIGIALAQVLARREREPVAHGLSRAEAPSQASF